MSFRGSADYKSLRKLKYKDSHEPHLIPLRLLAFLRDSSPMTKPALHNVFLFGLLFSAPAVYAQGNIDSSASATLPPNSAKQSKHSVSKSHHLQLDLAPAEGVNSPQALEESQGEHEALSSPEEESPAMGPSPQESENQVGEKRGEMVIAPIPLSNPAIGSGLVLGLGYIFPLAKDDERSPPSMIGGAGMYASSGSWALGAATKLYFKEDRYRLTAVYGRGEIDYSFYGIGDAAGRLGISIPIHQGGRALLIEPLFHLKWNLFLGPRYQWRSLGVQFSAENLPPDFEFTPKELNAKTAALGFHLQQDRRNSQFYPDRGRLIDVIGDVFHQGIGSDLNYQSYNFALNTYSHIGAKQVLAFRAYGCAVTGDVPFYDLCFVGAHNDIRGYQSGRYQDRRLLATQLEYRLELPKRVGLVGFFGVAEVAPTIGKFNAENMLPAGGVGLRYMVARKNHLNLRFDYGVGKDGGGFYMGLGEAF
jgi:Omp85 superfamily domain